MFEIVFITLVLLYALLSAKVDEWITISALGFPTETPLLFLRKPILYDVACGALFLGAFVASFGMSSIPWYIGLGILAFVWLVAGLVGRQKAFNNYRKVLHEMMEYSASPEEKAKYEAASNKTDQELLDLSMARVGEGIPLLRSRIRSKRKK